MTIDLLEQALCAVAAKGGVQSAEEREALFCANVLLAEVYLVACSNARKSKDRELWRRRLHCAEKCIVSVDSALQQSVNCSVSLWCCSAAAGWYGLIADLLRSNACAFLKPGRVEAAAVQGEAAACSNLQGRAGRQEPESAGSSMRSAAILLRDKRRQRRRGCERRVSQVLWHQVEGLPRQDVRGHDDGSSRESGRRQ